jgi:hypothetical protein
MAEAAAGDCNTARSDDVKVLARRIVIRPAATADCDAVATLAVRLPVLTA